MGRSNHDGSQQEEGGDRVGSSEEVDDEEGDEEEVHLPRVDVRGYVRCIATYLLHGRSRGRLRPMTPADADSGGTQNNATQKVEEEGWE